MSGIQGNERLRCWRRFWLSRALLWRCNSLSFGIRIPTANPNLLDTITWIGFHAWQSTLMQLSGPRGYGLPLANVVTL
ncbi:hypothetical protein M405DRAFT_835030 [Rhizopogon salebrosus TDB-379]|nr:hypothetical protein M405DRAFT_835030 [Rhizopogon salebrosus TDB-379]